MISAALPALSQPRAVSPTVPRRAAHVVGASTVAPTAERVGRPCAGSLNQIPRHPDFHTVSWSTLGWYVDPLVGGESNPGQSSIWTASRRFLQSKFLFVGLHTLYPIKVADRRTHATRAAWSCHVRPRAPCLPGHMLRRGWRPSPWPARQSTSQAARQDRPVGLERLEQRWHAVYSRSDAGGLRWHQGCWRQRRLAAAAAGQRESRSHPRRGLVLLE